MATAGLTGRVGKHVVLRGWDTIVDCDRTYQIKVAPLPDSGMEGATVYVIAQDGSPDLTKALVVEDRGDSGLFVEPIGWEFKTQFLVSRAEAKRLPVPYRPLAIRRSDLALYIGDEAANAWTEQRRARQRTASK